MGPPCRVWALACALDSGVRRNDAVGEARPVPNPKHPHGEVRPPDLIRGLEPRAVYRRGSFEARLRLAPQDEGGAAMGYLRFPISVIPAKACFKRWAAKEGALQPRGRAGASAAQSPWLSRGCRKIRHLHAAAGTLGCPAGAAVGITLQNYARHHLTNNDGLYRIPGLTHEEARLIVRDEVEAILARWEPTIRMRPAATSTSSRLKRAP